MVMMRNISRKGNGDADDDSSDDCGGKRPVQERP